ncbi:MAG: lysine--tRNA ligase [archaeon]
MEEKDISDLRKSKEENLRKLIELNSNPYAYGYEKNSYTRELHERHGSIKIGTEIKKPAYRISGRITSLRSFGKLVFGDLVDGKGKIQFCVKKGLLSKKEEELFGFLDRGDIIGIEGTVFKTKKGELTLLGKKLTLLTKSIEPLPEKWHGLKDMELRYRQRYVDLIVNPGVREVFEKRNEIVQAIREYLKKEGYMEVETPVLQPIYGGTNAHPFESFLHELKMKVYMRISNELYLKRLIVGGYEKIFEFSRDFRNEGIDKTHNPEFLQMETMCAYADYKDNMGLCEEMIEFTAKKVLGKTKISYQGKEIDLKKPWKKISFNEALKKYAGIDAEGIDSIEKARKEAGKAGIELKEEGSIGSILMKAFEEKVQPQLIQPTMVYDYPSEIFNLAKVHRNNAGIAEAFEPIIAGIELGLSYSEENNPEILKEKWKKAEEFFKKGDIEAQRMDNDFIRALEYGMPPTSGLGIGIDRLAMILTDSVSIRDVILFPFMRPEKQVQ